MSAVALAEVEANAKEVTAAVPVNVVTLNRTANVSERPLVSNPIKKISQIIRKNVFVTLPGVSVVLANLHELANEVNGGNGRIKKCLSEKF